MYKQICPKTVPSEFKVSGVYCISLGEHFYIGSSKNDVNSPYILPKRNSFIYDVNHKRIYKDLKEASKILNLSTYKLSIACKKQTNLLYINYCASVKLRESGKLFIEDNPNPSSTEM